ncbi:elongation factor G [Striga asiatica]|uniref:Elongation factor G n=1 Tax=Striga asiatica TaxID=4170 RepID=A0A5A7R434_STRAF|nr:elongation factor G [Striga asiatica]
MKGLLIGTKKTGIDTTKIDTTGYVVFMVEIEAERDLLVPYGTILVLCLSSQSIVVDRKNKDDASIACIAKVRMASRDLKFDSTVLRSKFKLVLKMTSRVTLTCVTDIQADLKKLAEQ